MTGDWVIADDLPLEELRSHDFEECIYWILDAMKADDLAWRKGSAGKHGTADGGRDLEAKFVIPMPSAGVREEHWWIDAKGRTGTLEKSEVQKVVLNAQSEDDLDVFVVATNTTFSNPTRDWVKDFQKKNRVPRIELWDGDDIRRLLTKFPTVVARLFTKALSAQGKLDVVSSRLWNQTHYSDCQWLESIWSEKENLKWNYQSVVAVIACEAANGDFSARPWAAVFDDELLYFGLANSLSNTLYFIQKLAEVGAKQEPLIDGISYLLVGCLLRAEPDVISQIIQMAFQNDSGKDFPIELRNIVLSPILNATMHDLLEVCSYDCGKVIYLGNSPSDDDAARFSSKFIFRADKKDESKKQNMTMQKLNEPCQIGLECVDDNCPLTGEDIESCSDEKLKGYLLTIQRVAKFRIENPSLSPSSV